MPLPQKARKLTNDCAGADLSSVTSTSVLLFVSQKESLAPLSPRGSVNECSLLNPGFVSLGSGNRMLSRDMSAYRQMRICLALLHVFYTCICPFKPFRLNLGQQTEEKGGTGSHKEG